ncbi:sugar 3,4-ketoisomerase [Zhongshania sp. BJYM1]|uniref:sugar 3,4-ketoisomerase n=1 Tax=Zhongshania aquatica TaxID=2965069 RepID=UPI0022B39BA4|nr:FdtA/QdtA family cupin domain-containing protein [Marortus sp. BJYM1]
MESIKSMSIITMLDLPVRGDDRGSLIALEGGITLPFEIKRVYYIFDTSDGVSRGFHAHKKLQQLMVCLSGRCRVVLDDGVRREEVWLESPTQGLQIGNMIWREMHDLSPGCVILVVAGEYYNEDDYIRSYQDFLELSA